jgi:hypothetical protein
MDVEGVFRSANERIAERATALAFEGEIAFLCECDDPTCFATIGMALAEYADRRRVSGVPITLPEHRIQAPPRGASWQQS